MSTALLSHDAPTSLAAAEVAQHSAQADRAKIFTAIFAAGIHGLTREEIEDKTGIKGNTVRPRVCDLIKQGLIVESDEIRPTRSGCMARVLIAKHLPPVPA